MHFVSPEEKAQLEKKRQDLYNLQLEVQERIRKAAALGDLSENAEYHFAKEENRNVQRQLAELEAKLKSAAVVSNDAVPEAGAPSRSRLNANPVTLVRVRGV